MQLFDAVNCVQQIHWDFVSTFEVYFAFNYDMLNNSRTVPNSISYDTDANGGKNVLAWKSADNERISLHIKNFKTPQLSSNIRESFSGNRFTHLQGKPSTYKFSMTFRDSNQLEFYRMFATQLREQQYRYFDDFCFNVFISKDSDYADGYHTDDTGELNDGKRGKPLMSMKRCMVESVSQIDFNQDTEHQIVEFSVDFIANDIEIYDGGGRQFYKGYTQKVHSESDYFADSTKYGFDYGEDYIQGAGAGPD